MPSRPCPYLPGFVEQNVFTDLSGPDSDQYYHILSQAGFRRSHGIAYRPACPGCSACVPVRVVADAFAPGRTLRRIWKANAQVTSHELPPRASREQYELFSRYLRARHGDGEMASMDFADYQAMVEETTLDTSLIEFRHEGRLVGGCLTDRLRDGLSAVYSFFEPAMENRSIGNLMVMRLIEAARNAGLSYVYLGYWIDASPKMAYKQRFRPLEGLGPEGWYPLR